MANLRPQTQHNYAVGEYLRSTGLLCKKLEKIVVWLGLYVSQVIGGRLGALSPA
jgi:hypothetical protein